MADLLKIAGQVGRQPAHRILRLAGPLSLETVPSFLKMVRAESAPVVILDMSEVGIVDSAGVGALIQTHVGYAKAQRRLVLTHVNSRNMAVFEITRVSKAFHIFPSVQEAEAAL
jgi:anti-sigma B factor antagonist